MHLRQKLGLAAGTILSLGVAGVLIVNAVPGGPSYYATVSEVGAGKTAGQTFVRVGGTVKKGSLRQRTEHSPATLILADGTAELAVRTTNILPALLREGDDAVAEGRLEGGILIATSIIPRFDDPLKKP